MMIVKSSRPNTAWSAKKATETAATPAHWFIPLRMFIAYRAHISVSVAWRTLDHMTPATLLAFERDNPGHATTKWLRIRDQLGLTETRYYLLLTRAASSEAGIAADPVTARLVRDRAARRRVEREKRMSSTPPGG
ncbi:DUF3263 domain-containing protein [Microbacterium sp. LWH12-1.2]|uniref:DUF3263 domain-containing protein n=1 Tax=Microbacterium sp. LWH12-1.2 TaxID=3135259 RepID=UPI00343C6A2A